MFLVMGITGKVGGATAEHLFDRFFRGDPSHSRTIEGTGLGLAITKRLVEQHCGYISLKSEPGNGTCFTFIIPLGRP